MKKLLLLATLLCVSSLTFSQTFDTNGLSYIVNTDGPNTVTLTGRTPGNTNTVIDIPFNVVGNGSFHTVTSIGDQAFQSDGITSVTISTSITSIGLSAFANNQLTTVNIPFTVTSLGTSAFANNQLTSVNISDFITTIGIGVFQDNLLTSVTIGNNVTSIGSRAFQDNLLTSVTIGNSVDSIGNDAFLNNQLSSVTIPNSVTTIGNSAFRSNPITSLTIGNSVTSIGDQAFFLNQLSNVTFPDSLISIGNSAFSINQLTNVTFGNGVISIGNNAFNQNQLSSVIIPNSMTTIGNSAFSFNQLTSVTLGNSLTNIGDTAFTFATATVPNTGEYNLIFIGETPPTIQANSFIDQSSTANRSDITVNVPCTSLASYTNDPLYTGFFDIIAPDNTAGLTYVINTDDPTTVTITGRSANNMNTDIVIPDTISDCNGIFSVTNIEDNAFNNNQLTSVIIGDNVTHIGSRAFRTNQLNSVTIGNSVTNIGQEAFQTNLLTTLTIPDNVTSMGLFAFATNELTSVTIGNGVTNIPVGAFQINQLTSVTFGDNLNNISSMAFFGNQLTSIVIPNSVTLIGSNVFNNNQLTSVVLGNNISNFGFDVFQFAAATNPGTGEHRLAFLRETPPGIVASTFINQSGASSRGDITVFVPCAALSAYEDDLSYTGFFEFNPPVVFTAPADLCIDTGIQTGLSGGLSEGGVYSGPGVIDDGNGMTYSFDPANAGAGIHTITYTFTNLAGCITTASDTLEVVPLPTVTFTAPADVCLNAETQTGLSGGTPSVSILSTTVVLNLDYEDVFGPGSGVTGGEIIFDPSGAMLSTNLIFFGNANGNVAPLIDATASGNTITLDFQNGPIGSFVTDAPIIGATGNLNFISGTDLIIDGDDFTFVSATGTATTETVGSGIYAGPGVTSEASGTLYSFDPAVAGVGTHIIEYTFTDANGCAASASDTIEVFTEMSEFITTWKTDNPGTSNDNQITIPAIGGNYTVDWGDMSTPDTNVSGAMTHTYTTAGTYTVTISGTFPTIFFNDGGDKDKILSVENWGNSVWNSMSRAFHGCSNLIINALDAPDLSMVTSMAGMFDGASSMNQDIGDWDVSNVQNLDGMFRNTPFNQDISSWDVSNVSVFAFMFDGATAFNQDLSAWGTRLGSADNMASMFRGATAFNGSVENWDVTTVTNMVGVFEGTAFNRDINNWNVSNVSNMAFMFSDATAFNQPLNDWATRLGNVTDMTNMFEGGTAFNQEISNWDVSNVQLMAGMFSGATSFNMPIGAWGATTASVVNMEFMFNEATSFDQDLGGWNVENVSNMTAMFFGVTLSADNYDSLLTGWSTQTLQNDVEFDAGNSGYCTAEAVRQSIIDNFNWDIIDIGPENIPPVISDCPTDVMVPEPANPTDCGAIATFTTPTAIDNCSTATITQVAGPTSGSFFPSGTTVVTFEAVDAVGNTATCSFNVIVANSTPPVAICQPFTLQLDANGMATLNPQDIDGGSTDDCNSISLSVSPSTFTCADVGTPQMVTLTVDDGSGNIDTCTTMVTVEDSIAPTINCQDLTIDLDMSGTITLDPATVLANLATFEVVLVSGNNDSNLPGSSDITVPITEDVTITFDWTYATDDGAEFDPFGYLLNGVFTELTDIAGDDFNQSGTENVMLSNGDTFGFRAFTLDNTFGPATSTITNFQPGFQGQFASANWTETLTESDGSAVINENLAVFDACGINTITMSQTTFTTADIGSNPVIYTVTDVNGNVNTCNAFVNVFSAGTSCPTTTTYTTAEGWDNGTPNATTRAILNDDYSTAIEGDIIACELIINSEVTFTITDGRFINITNDIITNGDLIVENTGSIVQIEEDAITINSGTISISKTTPTLDDRNFVAMSSPVTAEIRDRVYGNSRAVFSIIPSNFVPFAIDFVEFPEFEFAENFLDDNNDYLLPVIGSTVTPAAGIGQLVFPQPEPNVGDGAYTLTYIQSPMNPGTLNSGTITVPINYNGPATTNNYNLLGNPYASAIDVTAFITANDAVNEVYYWDHITNPTSDLPGFGTSNFSMNDISIRNAMMGIAAVNGGTEPGQFMASGQGFGIKADQAEMTAGTPVVFTNSTRVTGNNDGFRSSETSTDIDKLWLNLTTIAYDEAIAQTGIGFTPNATPAIDKGYDSPRVGTFLSLFTILETGEQLAIQGREAFDADMEIALGFSTTIEENASYTIDLNKLEGIHLEETPIFLIDHLLGTTTNLKETPYSFTSERGIQSERFTMVFKEREVLDVDEESFRESGINLYPNPSEGQITLAYVGTATLENAVITDVNGKIIKRIDLTHFNQSQTIDLDNLARGMYFMRITSQENTVIKKLILR